MDIKERQGIKTFVVATRNEGKIKEIREIMKCFPFNIISMEQYGITGDIEETGTSFEENALIKATAVHKTSGGFVMADDSGLEVDFLNGSPGIYSSRFAGENASDKDRNDKLLKLMEGVPFEKRTARFVCAVAVVLPDGTYFTVRGTCEGYIAFEVKGDNGFGYDPLFYMPEYEKTVAQMPKEVKNSVSHRGKALKLMVEELGKYV